MNETIDDVGGIVVTPSKYQCKKHGVINDTITISVPGFGSRRVCHHCVVDFLDATLPEVERLNDTRETQTTEKED
jgi:hypothetical protein